MLALGLSKGAIIFLHVNQLDRVFCRFTIHRAAITAIKYLPKTKCFISICQEFLFKVWKLNNVTKSVNVIQSLEINKLIHFFEIIPTGDYDS